jgi:Leucine-rich repeat (LRR) protein
MRAALLLGIAVHSLMLVFCRALQPDHRRGCPELPHLRSLRLDFVEHLQEAQLEVLMRRAPNLTRLELSRNHFEVLPACVAAQTTLRSLTVEFQDIRTLPVAPFVQGMVHGNRGLQH